MSYKVVFEGVLVDMLLIEAIAVEPLEETAEDRITALQ